MMRVSRLLHLRKLLFAGAILCPPKSYSQALPTATGPASTVQVGVGLSSSHIDYGERWLSGPLVWFDYKPLLHLGVEGELRSLRYNQDLGIHGTTYLVGPTLNLHRSFGDPYFKAMIGSGRLTFPYSYAHGTYLVVAAGAGLDVHVGERMTVRVIDVSYQEWPQFSFGMMKTYGASAGISLTLRRGATWRSDRY